LQEKGRQGHRLGLAAARYALVVFLAPVCALALHSQPARAAVTRMGKLQATVFDDFRHDRSVTHYRLRSGNREITVRPTELAAEPGDTVAVTGKLQDGRLVGSVEPTGASPQAEALSPGPRKVAVLLFTFSGEPEEPWGPEETRSKVFTAADSADAFYEEESYGGISLAGKLNADGDVFGWLTVDAATDECQYAEWKAAANEAAADAGIDLSGYQHIVYVFPKQSSCSWLGLAAIGGDWAMINGNLGVHPIAHELGHNLGLRHAGSWTCTENEARVQISEDCTITEYGDPFDVMGNIAARHSSGWNLDKLGILAPENIQTVEESGTYTLHSALYQTTEPTVLRIPRKQGVSRVSSWYYLELRQTGGVFESAPFAPFPDPSTEGVSIRVPTEDPFLPAETLLLDANPGTATFEDAPLAAGETFEGEPLPVKVKTLSAGAGSATVSIEVDDEPPTAPTELTATTDAEGVHLRWSPSTDDHGVDRYVVYRDGAEAGIPHEAEFVDRLAPSGEHTYVVYAEDATRNRSTASEPVTVAVPDASGPTCEAATCTVAYRRSGAPASWIVPPGVSEVELTVEGAQGGTESPLLIRGRGARIVATMGALTEGEAMTVRVGGAGRTYAEGGAGGTFGGGDGALGGGGGGYSSVEADSTLELLAGGGGGRGLDGFNSVTEEEPGGGTGGYAGKLGTPGADGHATESLGATLQGGEGGEAGGNGGAAGGEGGVSGASSCAGGASPGAAGAPGGSFAGGGGDPDAGGGGGGGYVGGGQGGGAAGDECGSTAGSGGGGGGSSYVAPELEASADFLAGIRRGDGQVSIAYPNPIGAIPHGYRTQEGQPLVISATSGVLSGAALASESLSASVAGDPAHGSLSLDPDGSFVYAPEPGYTGIDTFAYRAVDTVGDYATAAVNIRVAQLEPEPEPIPTPSGNGGGSGETRSPEPAPEPLAPAPPAIAVGAAHARVVHGVARVRLSCRGGGPGSVCRGIVSLSRGALFGRTRYAVARGRTRIVRVKLRRSALRRLRRSRRGILRVRATASAASGWAHRVVVLHLHTRRSGRSPVRKQRSSHH
jgi:Bacterial Ig domain/Gametolysin peptidase M11